MPNDKRSKIVINSRKWFNYQILQMPAFINYHKEEKGMKLLADSARGLSVALKILLMDEQVALCNIIRMKELLHRQLLQIHQNFKENNSICIDELL